MAGIVHAIPYSLATISSSAIHKLAGNIGDAHISIGHKAFYGYLAVIAAWHWVGKYKHILVGSATLCGCATISNQSLVGAYIYIARYRVDGYFLHFVRWQWAVGIGKPVNNTTGIGR